MIVLVCGSRTWTDRQMIYDVLRDLRREGFMQGKKIVSRPTIIHGAAKGADMLADSVAKELKYPRHRFPADWDQHGKRAGPIRNSQMLKEGKPDWVIAFAL